MAAPPEERRLLVDDGGGDRNAIPEDARLADRLRVADDVWQFVRVDVERVACFGRPAPGAEIEEQRARCGRGVGDECAGQPVQQPGVGRGDDAVPGHVLPEPSHLGRGEVRVERQPRDLVQAVGVGGEGFADARRAAILPRDRLRERCAAARDPRRARSSHDSRTDGDDGPPRRPSEADPGLR